MGRKPIGPRAMSPAERKARMASRHAARKAAYQRLRDTALLVSQQLDDGGVTEIAHTEMWKALQEVEKLS